MPWFFILSHHFPSLLFLRAYQGLARSLPSSLAIFPSAPRLPVPPELIGNQPTSSKKAATGGRRNHPPTPYSKQISERIDDCIGTSKRDEEWRRIVFVSGQQGLLGASTAAAMTFSKQLDDGRQCVWIDLDEVASCNDLFELILHTVARKAGVTDWMPVLLQSERSNANQKRIELAQLNEIARLTNNPNREWLIFLNGRCCAGGNFLLTDDYAQFRKCYPNGWLDWRKDAEPAPDPIGFNADGPTTSADHVIDLLHRLCGPDCRNVSTVFLCYEGPFFEAVRQMLPKISDPICIRRNELSDPPGKSGKATSTEVDSPRNPTDIVQNALDWINEEEPTDRRHFLYVLALTNRLRYPASMWTWPFHQGEKSTATRVSRTDRWQSALEEKHVIRRKRGGFIWMHCDIRNQLRLSIPEGHEELINATARIHHGLAEWNQKLLIAADTPSPAFEIVYHRCQQAVAMLKNRQVTDGNQLLAALSDAMRALETAQSAMLSEGFSKSVCRRLQQVRDTYIRQVELSLEASSIENEVKQPVRHRLQLLRLTSLRLNAMVAREVGENVTAFERYRELRVWQYVARWYPEWSHEEQVDKVRSLLKLFQPEPAQKLSTNTSNRKRSGNESARTKRDKQTRMEIVDLDPYENVANWITFCNESGTLALAARCFDYSDKSFKRVLKKLGFPEDLNPEQPVYGGENRKKLVKWLQDDILSRCKKLKLEELPEDDAGKRAMLNEIHAGLLKTFERKLQLQMAKANVLLTVSRREPNSTKRRKLFLETQECLAKAKRCTGVARLILEVLNRDDQRFAAKDSQNTVVREDFSRWFDERQRTDTLDALAHSAGGDFERALRHLNEAESALDEARHDRHAMESAIIDLHRVEVLTQQAMFGDSRLTDDDRKNRTVEMSPLGKLRHEVLASAHFKPHGRNKDASQNCNPHAPRELGSLFDKLREAIKERITRYAKGNKKSEFDISILRNDLRSSLSSLKDAWQALTRAERQLRKHRKNVWWTTWFFELELKVVELRVFAAVFERVALEIMSKQKSKTQKALRHDSAEIMNSEFDCLLPHIGLEAAPHGTPTIADRLIDNANRMVRLDLYRIARSAESYSNCVLGLTLWRACLKEKDVNTPGSEWKELDRRQREMCLRLVGTSDPDGKTRTGGIKNSINARKARREELDDEWPMTELDGHVIKYVDYVQEHLSIVTDLAVQGLWSSYDAENESHQ